MKSLKSVLLLPIACYLLSLNTIETQNKTIEKTGDVILFVLPIITLATTFILNDKKGSWQFTKGLLLTEGITYGL